MLPEQQVAFDFYLSGKSFFLTGSGGSGKSFVLNKIIEHFRAKHGLDESKKTLGVTAMTGASACLISGSTLHSWANISLGLKPAKEIVKKIRLKPLSVERWRNCKLLIIDEVSMMSLELFEKLDEIARVLKTNNNFFGGIQMIFSGDFAQLPPIERDGGRVSFVFQSQLWQRQLDSSTVYLTQIVRQTDPVFQGVLTQARLGELTPESRAILRSRVVDDKKIKELMHSKTIQPTVLYSYRAQVESINEERLTKLIEKGSESHRYLPEYSYLIHTYLDPLQKRTLKTQISKLFGKNADPSQLLDYPPLSGNRGNTIVTLTIGAQVMLTYNLAVEEGLANGSRGYIFSFENVGDESRPVVKFDNGIQKTLERVTTITEQLGVDLLVMQYPLALAWSTTIHKAIGSTITSVIADLSNCFSPGQSYTALSRCRTIEGLYLTGINFSAIKCHPAVREYYRRFSYKCRSCDAVSGRCGFLGRIEICEGCFAQRLKITLTLARTIISFV
jgi:ATP-dependent DNA helicase PIF1